MKLKKLMLPIAILVICSPGIALAQQIMMEAGDVKIVKEENGRIEVDTGNTQMRVPQQSVEDDYFTNSSVTNSSNSRQVNHNSGCETRIFQSTHQSNNNGSKKTVTQTNTSTNICH